MKKNFFFKFLVLLPFIVSFSPAPVLATTPHSWDQIGKRDNLYFLKDQNYRGPEEIADENNRLIQEINAFAPNTPGRANGVSIDQAALILKKMQDHPVVSNSGKYDPKYNIGFCFGRALFAHLELLRHGVAKAAIKKAFLIGPMKSYSPNWNWQFHVAIIVKANLIPGWYVIDTSLSKPILLEKWLNKYYATSLDQRLKLFITNPEKIGPDAWEYNIRPGGLFDPFYNDYFKDMFLDFKKHPVPEEQKFIQKCSRAFQ